MSGSISLSLSQQFDRLGKPLAGGKLFTYAAGTTTPQSAFQDTGLVLPLSNPIILDAGGRLPQLFFADGNIKIVLTDAHGVTQLAADNILVIGPSAAGGGGATVDPTAILQTGWIQPIYGTGNVTGFVRANGRTLGNASSGATERANADTQALYVYLWNTDANLTVSTGRGASAANDFAANKTIALPDGRGSVLAALDDMGNSAAGKFASVGFISGNATTLGSRLGAVTQPIAQANLPNVAPTFTGNLISGLGLSGASGFISTGLTGQTAPGVGFVGQTGSARGTVDNFTPSGTVGSINGGVAQQSLPTIQPTLLITLYLKL